MQVRTHALKVVHCRRLIRRPVFIERVDKFGANLLSAGLDAMPRQERRQLANPNSLTAITTGRGPVSAQLCCQVHPAHRLAQRCGSYATSPTVTTSTLMLTVWGAAAKPSDGAEPLSRAFRAETGPNASRSTTGAESIQPSSCEEIVAETGKPPQRRLAEITFAMGPASVVLSAVANYGLGKNQEGPEVGLLEQIR